MRTFLTFALALMAPAAAWAQTPLSLTLDDAIARGLQQAPRVAEARARTAAASSTVAARNAARLPAVSVNGMYQRTNHIDEFLVPQPDGPSRVFFPDIPNVYGVRAEVDVPLFPTQLALAVINAARADMRVLDASRRAVESDLRLEIARAYWTLVTARETVRVLEQGLQRTDASVRDVKARVDAGFLPPNDLLSAQALRARQSVQLIQARNSAAIAEADLGRLVGADPGQAIAPVTPVDQALPGVAELARQPAAALAERAREQRAERVTLREQQASLHLTGVAALATLQPLITATGGVEPARPNARFVPRVDEWKTSWDVGVNVRWPIWDGGRARANQAAAAAQEAAVGHRLEEFDALVALEIRQRLLNIESGRAALDASAEAVAAATEARRVVAERFSAGVATSTDLLESQVALLEAELERTRLAAALRFDEARLVHAVGGL